MAVAAAVDSPNHRPHSLDAAQNPSRHNQRRRARRRHEQRRTREHERQREGGARGAEREGRGRMEETQSTKKRDLTIVYNEWSNSKGFANRFEWVCAMEAII